MLPSLSFFRAHEDLPQQLFYQIRSQRGSRRLRASVGRQSRRVGMDVVVGLECSPDVRCELAKLCADIFALGTAGNHWKM